MQPFVLRFHRFRIRFSHVKSVLRLRLTVLTPVHTCGLRRNPTGGQMLFCPGWSSQKAFVFGG